MERNFAGAMTSTWFTSAPRGSCTSRWRSMPWSTASMSPSKSPPPCRSTSAGNWSNTAEKTQRHCMMLENCVYDFFELTTLNMAQHGLFGEDTPHRRALYSQPRTLLGLLPGQLAPRLLTSRTAATSMPRTASAPACQLLDIHRGDKMNYLVAMDTSRSMA